MAFNVTSNYSGGVFGQYISAALKEAKSLEGLTVLENIKYKENIRKMTGSSLVADATCDFTDAGTLALTEAVLTPKNLQINVDLCKKTLLSGWEAEEMKAGAFNRTAPSFDQYVLAYFGELIADSVEGSIWSGAAATAGEFEGFLTATTGAFAVNGNVVQTDNTGGAATAYTAANIISNLQTLVAGIPANVYGRDDLRIYMNMKSYRFYVSAISTLGYVNAYNMNGDYVPVFEGITIQPCPGMPDNQLVAAETSNLFYGTDLLSDDTNIKMLDMTQLDGSDNMRVVAKFSGGVQVGIGSDAVQQN
tara:strand:+ start:19 stop:933 length:915 start_codon:yes stop_codon:yes gene_type:complete